MDWGAGVSGVLLPGQTGYGRVYLSPQRVPPMWSSYESRVRGWTTTAEPRLLSLTNVRKYYAYGRLHISGTVTNDGPRVTERGLVFVVMSESSGALYDVGYITFRTSDHLGRELDPGESFNFDIRLWREDPLGGSYEVSVLHGPEVWLVNEDAMPRENREWG